MTAASPRHKPRPHVRPDPDRPSQDIIDGGDLGGSQCFQQDLPQCPKIFPNEGEKLCLAERKYVWPWQLVPTFLCFRLVSAVLSS